MVVMNSKLKLTCFATLVLLFFNAASSADLVNPTLVFKMTADKTALLPGEQTTGHIWAWIYTPTGIEEPNNGLDTWQLDLSVDTTSVIEILSLNVLAPNPNPAYPPYQLASLNNPITGEVRRVAVSQLVTGAPSLTGVGVDNDIDNPANYSEICNFTIRAIQDPLASSASYTIMNDGGGGWFGILADSKEFDNESITAYGGTYFYASGSDHVFTIIPEPATVVLFAAAAAFALRRRK
ncbi:MAG: PEP-CTERM sorting domain-containing protein [Sedimentisphaerales bacterium]|nr:PEP-CTERM sorting domain-containing protein [Sedimentisphaerales bacterium]